MQIELIGCTSAGKTSLARKILEGNHQNGLHLVTSYDFVLRWAHLDWIKGHRFRMLALNLVSLSACLLTLRKNFTLYQFALGVILRLPAEVRRAERLKLIRIVARNVGIDEIVRRNSSDRQVILADEGTLQIANYLFVHVSKAPNLDELETYLRLAPLPDIAGYIRQPESVLIARTKSRGHKRIPENAPILVNRFVRHSLAVFEKLAACPCLEGRLLVINNGEAIQPANDFPADPRLEFARKILGEGGSMRRDNLKPALLDLGRG